jgi:AraC-like DNA-binding protein
MITSNYKLTSYSDYLHQLADLLGTTVHDGQLLIPEHAGTGYLRVISFADKPETILYNFTLRETLVLRREPDNREHYTLVLDELERERGFQVKIGEEEPNDVIDRPKVFYLTSFLYDVETILYQNVNVKGIRVLLTPEWMQQYLQLDKNEAVLEKYIMLKTAGIWYKPVTEEVSSLLHDLLDQPNAPLLFLQNKVFRIIELFFEWLYDEMKVTSGRSGISRQDVEMAQKIEARLTADVTQLPPTLKELAREVAMSESKLKKIFKAVYGLPPYEYFQRQRMQKARLMLLSGNYSVKDIGYTLGYANLSNFTLAFKKVFGKVPSQMLPK